MKIMLTAAIAVAAVTGANASIATAPVPAVKVFYGDLDLGSAAGMKTLQSRVAVAARTVCGTYTRGGGIDAQLADRQCRQTATDHAGKRFAARSGRQFASR